MKVTKNDDVAKNIKEIILTQTSYDYDKLNRLEKVKDQNNKEIVNYIYDQNGNRQQKKYANGIETSYEYNLVNNLTVMINEGKNKESEAISKYEYTYYLDGNHASEREQVLGLKDRYRKFFYDGLNRITNEKQNDKQEFIYAYDDNNNRKSKEVKGSDTLPYLDELLKNIKILYNGNNQMIEATVEGISSQYIYNADGKRLQKNVDGDITNHILDGNYVIAETDGKENIDAIYQRGLNLLTMDKDGKRLYYIYNTHGDVVQLADEKGDIVRTYQYDAFGNQLNPLEDDVNPFRYAGEYYDKETGYYYLRARYYDPKIGRFTTEDTYWGRDDDPLSLNIYTYCTNNPIMYVDPSGNKRKSVKAIKELLGFSGPAGQQSNGSIQKARKLRSLARAASINAKSGTKVVTNSKPSFMKRIFSSIKGKISGFKFGGNWFGKISSKLFGSKGARKAFNRNITDTSEIDGDLLDGLTYEGQIQTGGRSGQLRPVTGKPNSYVDTSGGHRLIYDSNGDLIFDISPDRVKIRTFDVAPNGHSYPRDFKLEGPVPNWLLP